MVRSCQKKLLRVGGFLIWCCVCKCVDSSHVGKLCLFKECCLAAENSIKLRHLSIVSPFFAQFLFPFSGMYQSIQFDPDFVGFPNASNLK